MSVLLRPEEGSNIISHRENNVQRQGADNGELLLGKDQTVQCG